MRAILSVAAFLLAGSLSAQLTVMQGKKEFYNGNENSFIAYLDQNFYNLNPIEGIWVFSKVEYDSYGNVVSEEDNFARCGIVRDPSSARRDFIEFALEHPVYNTNKVIYNITTGGGGTGVYTCEGIGWVATNTAYTYDAEHDMILREGTPMTGSVAYTVGIRQYPKSAPKNTTGGSYKPNNQGAGKTTLAQQSAGGNSSRRITSARGWEPIVDWDNHIFPSYLLSMSTVRTSNFAPDPDYIGDPISVMGILIISPENNARVRIQLDATKYSRPVDAEFVLPIKGVQYSVYPKVSWDYDLLRGLKQSTPLDFTYRVTVNGRAFPAEYVTATLRSLNDCPLFVADYHGEIQDLKYLFAAYVNEENPMVDQMLGEALKQKVVSNFAGYQAGTVEDVLMQVYAIWKLLRDKGMKYSSITTSANTEDEKVFSQRVRTFDDAINTRQANCVDGTVVFASFLRAINISPILVTIPGHCFLGFYVDAEKTTPLFLETTMMGDMTAAQKCHDQSGKMQIPDAFSFLNNIKASDDFKCAIMAGTLTYYDTVEKAKQDASVAMQFQTIDVGEARKFGIKPIGH